MYWQDEKKHWHNQVIWGQEDLPTFAVPLYRLVCECGYREAEEKLFTADGGDWCWGIHDQYFADFVGILDWYHASKHIWDSGKLLHTDPQQVRSWVDKNFKSAENQRW